MSQFQPQASPSAPRHCRFCGYRIEAGAVYGKSDHDGPFCSRYCEGEANDQEPFVGQHGYKLAPTAIAPLDTLLPRGIRRNSLVLLSAEEGTRLRELQIELAWRRLQRDESAVIISYVDPPSVVVERFLSLGWNVIPYLERGDLYMLDCFTHRLSDRSQFHSRKNRWNRFLLPIVREAHTEVRDPSDIREVESRLDDTIEKLSMAEGGVVILDSVDEVESMIQDIRAENFIREVRADVCKSRFVPMYVGKTAGETDQSQSRAPEPTAGSTELAAVADGVVDLRLSSEIVPETRLTQIGIRQMDAVPYVPQWLTVEVQGSRGFVSFDPRTETRQIYDPAELAAAWRDSDQPTQPGPQQQRR